LSKKEPRNAGEDKDLLVEVARTLISLGIPRAEFYPVEKETADI